MNVMEVYKAYQGEGVRMGQRSVFVRFFGCNLHCKWCDTAYAINLTEWRKAYGDEEPFRVLEVDELVTLIERQGIAMNVVLTGGEPVLQLKLLDLIETLIHRDSRFNVTVETNGTRLPGGFEFWCLRDSSQVLWSISPKTSSSGEWSKLALETVQLLLEHARCQLKFVIKDVQDYTDVLKILASIKIPRQTPIVLQPEGSIIDQGESAYLDRLLWLQNLVKHSTGYDIRVLPQLHTLMHGQRRFV